MAELLNTPEAVRLGLHAALLLAQRPGERWTITRIARTLGVSAAHLAKVLVRLENAGLLKGKTGPTGGYTLARPAKKITLLAVYQAVAGALNLNRCPFAIPVCDGGCPLGNFLLKINRQLVRDLRETSLAAVKLNLEEK